MYLNCVFNVIQEILMERSISKCSDMSLNYLTSLGLQSFAQFAGTTGGKPALVFEVRNYSLLSPAC